MTIADALLAWYDRCARRLPWRGEKDPYRVWLSEIMLQQTQAETVKGYYARFLSRFDSVQALAQAPEDEVMKLWEGLGYYSRARNLHAAARAVARSGGAFPDSAEGLRQLPGVGPYAANAIASIAYGEPVPALDGNQARVLSRLLAWEAALKTPFDLEKPALGLLDRARPGDYNQALMDLGALVCTPRRPRCGECPLNDHCRAFALDRAEDFPRKTPPPPKREEDWCVLVIASPAGVLVRRRPKGLLGGLYEFCLLPGRPSPEEIPALLSAQGFLRPRLTRRLADSRHIFTHRIWRMQGYLAACDAAPEPYAAVPPEALNALAFPAALRVYRAEAEGVRERGE